ncbi:MAG: response regulator transcription factor [Proteobacteria bacterium]|nr:DNA-binding response regulator [Pseudomonadota bacterium]NOG61093.1 response regulator transcription factor [Pseudomonadota bacterium]
MLDINELLFGSRFRLFLLAAFGFIGFLAAIDIIADIQEGTNLTHIIVEIFVFFIAIFSASVISLRLLKEAKISRQLVNDITLELQKNRKEAREWRNETQTLLQGLSASINNQFERWALTPSEKEIGLFLLKGLSHKEIAYIRKVSEATARQQARSIYKKAGLSGRHDLAAFFLEELALPIN